MDPKGRRVAALFHSDIKSMQNLQLTGRRDNRVTPYGCHPRSMEVYPLARLKAKVLIFLQKPPSVALIC